MSIHLTVWSGLQNLALPPQCYWVHVWYINFPGVFWVKLINLFWSSPPSPLLSPSMTTNAEMNAKHSLCLHNWVTTFAIKLWQQRHAMQGSNDPLLLSGHYKQTNGRRAFQGQPASPIRNYTHFKGITLHWLTLYNRIVLLLIRNFQFKGYFKCVPFFWHDSLNYSGIYWLHNRFNGTCHFW